MNIHTESWSDWHVVSIEGEFVVKHLTAVRKALEPYEQEDSPRVALDLSKAAYIDSSSITLMLNYQKRLAARGGRLVTYGANSDLRSIFSIVNLAESVAVYQSRQTFKAAIGAAQAC